MTMDILPSVLGIARDWWELWQTEDFLPHFKEAAVIQPWPVFATYKCKHCVARSFNVSREVEI